MRAMLFWLAVIAALVWCGVVAQHALATWPHLPLDGSMDARMREALRNAQIWHVMRHAAAALLPAALVVWLASRLK